MKDFIPLQRQPGSRVSGILFLNMLLSVIVAETRSSCGTRPWSPGKGKRVGGSAYRRRKIAFRHTYSDQEVSKKLMTLCKRRYADTSIRLRRPPVWLERRLGL